jgi:hypothetical protein
MSPGFRHAKFGTAKLNQTSSGLQMSRAWTRPRLEQTAHSYDRLASRIEPGGVRQIKLPPRLESRRLMYLGRMAVPSRSGRTVASSCSEALTLRYAPKIWCDRYDGRAYGCKVQQRESSTTAPPSREWTSDRLRCAVRRASVPLSAAARRFPAM